MMKYSFYSQTLRKFENEQSRQYEFQGLTRVYLANKLSIDPEISDEDLMKAVCNLNIQYENKTTQLRDKYSLLDELLVDVDFSKFEN